MHICMHEHDAGVVLPALTCMDCSSQPLNEPCEKLKACGAITARDARRGTTTARLLLGPWLLLVTLDLTVLEVGITEAPFSAKDMI